VAADIQWYEILGRLALAAVLGAIVGFERESAGQDAGFRTHLLLAVGAALFGVVSVGAWDHFITDSTTNVRVDVTRVASYVAAGVGFIGGGAILKHAGAVRGITTAASLWTAAAIGLSTGVGLWFAGVAATVIALVALAALKPLSTWIDRRSHAPRSLVIIFDRPEIGADVWHVVQDLASASIRSLQMGEGHGGDTTELSVQFWNRPSEELVDDIVDRLGAEFGSSVRSVSLHH